MIKQRRHKRFSFREHVLIDGSQHCESMDISEGGLYISVIQQFGENTVIDVTIPFKDETLTVKAQVKYFQQGIGMGIELIDLNDKQKEKIKEIIENIEK